MLILSIILGAVIGILLLLLFLSQRAQHQLANELKELRTGNTNRLLHSSGGVSPLLIQEINDALTQMQHERAMLSRKQHSLDQMTTNISHDLRTPLTSAMGYLNMVLHSDLPEEEKHRELEIIEKRLLRLEDLINSFFELSKIISRGTPPVLTEQNLVAVLEDSIAHYFDEFSSRQRQIVFKCDTHKCIIRTNPDMLLRIFDNLINNALKHGKGDLTVTAAAGETVTLSFRNQLNGTVPDVTHIFDEFYTTDISRTKGNTGLGLAIAKQFTEMLGGTIAAEEGQNDFIISIKFNTSS